ncbi:GlxA family transcriptional regulator [Minwuia thermotolerans]|uniref:AraC family transcriptional regulator n=1 Tax=Minwuia thermotolerans TaxID=2056226 RepID=A0A2M9FX73_9PROT|nr:GlxA family transcriptional regulator [Minwuia thermotolerans]PJK28057.1 AraC family transcriptional regulator [Minwuia thermotolerans]
MDLSIIPHRIVFFLVPNFSMIAFASALEPLRLTNRTLGKTVYEWTVVSADGEPVKASNGLAVGVDLSLDQARHRLLDEIKPEMVLVCSGVKVENFRNAQFEGWLRSMHRRGIAVGGLCTGAWLLAQADLLEGKRCSIHWETLPAFAEKFPMAEVHADLCEIDDGIYTCAGGTAALDMMLHVIEEHFGQSVMTKVCEYCLIDRIRNQRDRQRLPLQARLGLHHAKLLLIIELMEANVSEPLSLAEISEYVGLSRRQVERLFRRHLGRSPARYYLEIRIDRARHLLLQSNMPIVDVAIACGFVSASHFSKCYREMYGRSPQMERAQAEAYL